MGHFLSPVSPTVDKLSNTNSFVFLRNLYFYLCDLRLSYGLCYCSWLLAPQFYCVSLLWNSTHLILQRDRVIEGLEKSVHDLILIMLLLMKRCPELPRKFIAKQGAQLHQDFGSVCSNPLFHALPMGSDHSFYSVKQVHNLFAGEEIDNLVYHILSCGSLMSPFWFPCICLILFICTRME